jgi:nickel-dependent lactate racemase
MRVSFSYGKTGLQFQLDDQYKITVMEPEPEQLIENPVDEVYQTLNNPMNSKPLKSLLQQRKKGEIVIVVEDHTRPMPTEIVLKALIRLFEELGIEDDQIKILVATGLHRPSNSDELSDMLGKEILKRYDIILHDANNPKNLEFVGKTTFGNQIYLNSRYVKAGFRIVTGYVEPHFFAGFSGGRKALVPGIAGKDTILFNHSAKNCDSPKSRWGISDGNPINDDAVEVARMVKPDFCINLTINSDHKITKVASGNIIAVHNYLVQAQKKACFQKIQSPFDICICGNGGYPLDQNLYQAVKSMAIGEMCVKKNGIIIAVNECSDAIGQDSFEKLINSGKSPGQIYKEAVDGIIKIPDVWEIQILARILMNFSIYVVSKMKKQQIGNIGLKFASSVEEAVELGAKELKLPKDKISIVVLPRGPLLLPEL